MCTAISWKCDTLYFGRTLDNEYSYKEEITITPRNFPFKFRNTKALNSHYAIIGMAFNKDGFPLYYDAMNEKGLCFAGLNFVGNACYNDVMKDAVNVAQFELLPFVLGQCDTVCQAEKLLRKINITNTPFSVELPTAQLHWIISDGDRSIIVEALADGLKIYENNVGVMSNNPPFPKQLDRLNDYMHLSPQDPENRFGNGLELKTYSKGMGAIGLPGDWSSTSRFVRGAFVRNNSPMPSENERVSQFFHIMSAIEQPKGSNQTEDGFEISIYTSCCDASKGVYYYTTYNNRQISGVDINKEELDGNELICYPLVTEEQINMQN